MNHDIEGAPGPQARGTGREYKQSNNPILPALARDVHKAWLSVQAQCLLAGFKADLIEGDDGRALLVVSRWALTRSFSDPQEVTVWLARVAPVAAAGVAP